MVAFDVNSQHVLFLWVSGMYCFEAACGMIWDWGLVWGRGGAAAIGGWGRGLCMRGIFSLV
jgi:hypothetical protein